LLAQDAEGNEVSFFSVSSCLLLTVSHRQWAIEKVDDTTDSYILATRGSPATLKEDHVFGLLIDTETAEKWRLVGVSHHGENRYMCVLALSHFTAARLTVFLALPLRTKAKVGSSPRKSMSRRVTLENHSLGKSSSFNCADRL
jgi:hypothetical protein